MRENNNVIMPISVTIFWWLAVTIVLCWMCITIWFLFFPSVHYVSTLGQLPSQFRADVRRADMGTALIKTSFLSILTLCLAWLAAFRRLNWARWGFIILFLVYKSVPLAVSLAYHRFQGYIGELGQMNWRDYPIPILALTAAAFVFSKHSYDWFHSRA